MAFPNKVVKENFKTTGKSAILSDRREIQILETTSKYLFSEKKIQRPKPYIVLNKMYQIWTHPQ